MRKAEAAAADAPDAARERLAAEALAAIPKILIQQDRTPVSHTFGCFDRLYWHTRAADFPCGMSQEYALPLALAWALPVPGSPWHGQAEVARWAEAGVRFAARSAHRDGSCDDYYPFERAAGAAAFSLFAALETAESLGLRGDAEIEPFLLRRANWLAHHMESGQLSNHEALIVACLARLSAGERSRWDGPLGVRVSRLLSWQSEEGWFDEYGGADPGYLTLTIGMMAMADRDRPDLGLRPAIDRAIAFLAAMVHPDGTLGGEYTSRATVNCFPHGLEVAGAWNPQALAVADRLYRRLDTGVAPSHADDRIIGHHVWSQLLAWREWQDERPGPLPLAEGLSDFPQARVRVQQHGRLRLFAGWSRGCAFRLFEGEQLLAADTGPTLQLASGRVAVTHLEGSEVVERSAEALEVEGPMRLAKSALLTPAKSILLRSFMLTVGRFFPDLVRRLLQALLVTGAKPAPFRFRRRIAWQADGSLTVTDEIRPDGGDWSQVEAAGRGGFQVSMTTVMARVWEPAQLQRWEDLTGDVRALGRSDTWRSIRRFGGD
ncbi:MAG: hypothetical protein ACK4MX_06260, partial [Thermaurantiacus sp.]